MLKYQIALTNAIFDDTYRNVLRFDTRAEQEAYFNVNTLFANAVNCNFNVGSLYATKVVVDFKDNNVDLNELMNNNYCIVKDNSENAIIKYYYYFVKRAQQECGNRLICDLELDVYQTYYIDITFDDCAILRAHLNRFIDNGDNTVSFDATPTSKLFEREDVQDLPKRLISRTKLNVNSGNNYYNENVLCWLYLYLDPTHDFTFKKPDGTTFNRKLPRIDIRGSGRIPTNIACLAIPIYKRNGVAMIVTNRTLTPTTQYDYILGGSEFLKNFEDLNNGYNYVYSAKLSLMPPSTMYYPNGQYINVGINPNSTGINAPSEIASGYFVIVSNALETQPNVGVCGIILNEQENVNFDFLPMQLNKELTFNKTDIIGANANIKFNPKLNNSDYYELNLTNIAGSNFSYDLQKLNTNNLNCRMSEALTPDFTKNYLRLLPPQSNTLYSEKTSQNLLGLVTSNDNTILLPTSAYQNMIAQNKNFYQQAEFNRLINAGKRLASATKDFWNNSASGNLFGAIGGFVGAGAEIAVDTYASIKNQNFEIDNLRNAPGSIAAAAGDFIFNSLYTEPGVYIEEYEITENSKKAVNDYMMRYGFNYNRIDNIKNVDNIRKNYNYVQAYIEEIKTGLVNISNIVHNKLREIFARGVRMWNARTFDYTKENYERWLEQ